MTSVNHRNVKPADADAIVIGAGINGLICATLLGQANYRVLILEAQDRPGGFCATGQIIPGFRTPQFSSWTGPLDGALIKTLKLQKFGLESSPQRLSTIALSADGHHIVLDGHARRGSGALAQHSQADAKTYPPFDAAMRKLAASLGPLMGEPPVVASVRGAPSPRFRLDDNTRAQLSGLALRAISGLLDEYFESPLLQGALALEATTGTGLGPQTPGSALAWIEKLASETLRSDAAVWFQGGPGALVHALTQCAQSTGATLRVKARVTGLVTPQGRVEGVILSNGESLYAPTIVSSLGPSEVLNWPDARRAAPQGFRSLVPRGPSPHGLAKVHLALRGLPQFKGVDAKDLRARLLIAGPLENVCRAYDEAVRGELSQTPPMEALVPSAFDASLAPRDGHVVSVLLPFVPLSPAGGWNAAKTQITLSVIAALGRYAPDLPKRVLATEIETPETLSRVTQSLLWRWFDCAPTDTSSPYSSPLKGLYFCGAGTHPRLGATGSNGRNCAEAILAAASPVQETAT